MKTVTLSSSYNFESGYKTLLQTLLDNLPKNNINVIPRSYSSISTDFFKYFENINHAKADLDLMLLPPCTEIDTTHPVFYASSHKNRVFFTMWESSRVGDVFIDQLNKTKAIIVPNKWNKHNFEQQGCEVPIHIVPLFIDENIFNYTASQPSNVFVFGTANNDPRKRVYDTVKCFLKAFPKERDVIFKIKTNTQLPFKFTDSRIQIINDYYDKTQLKNWYHSLNVFVSGVSAEGWGLHQHESMACGRPLIATKYAGLDEFLTNDNGFCLQYTETPSEGSWYIPGGKWSKYDETHMIETMRYCYHNPDVVERKGIIAHYDAIQFNTKYFIDNIRSLIDIYTHN